MDAPESSHQPDLRNRSRGQWGENLAARHYTQLGCRVLDRNWRSSTGELDLIVLDGDLHVFCEVKTRASDLFGPAAAAVTVAKQRRIRQLGVEWLRAHDLGHMPVRFDVAAVTGNRVELITNAF
jgi:putative endonuclease